MRLERGLNPSSERTDKSTPDYGAPTQLCLICQNPASSIPLGYLPVQPWYTYRLLSPGQTPRYQRFNKVRTMAAPDCLEDRDLVRNLLWPVCIAGCMAMSEHESYGRHLISSISGDRWSFGYPSKVLKIMEECWSLRKCQPGVVSAVDWMTAMKNPDIRVLLV
jgi:transcription factor-like protein